MPYYALTKLKNIIFQMNKCKNKQNIPFNVEFMILCVELIIRPILSDTCAEFLEEKVEIT